MMNREQAINFAKSAAADCVEEIGMYEGNGYHLYLQNLIDTLFDEYASEFESEAINVFDAEYQRLMNK